MWAAKPVDRTLGATRRSAGWGHWLPEHQAEIWVSGVKTVKPSSRGAKSRDPSAVVRDVR